MTADAIIFIPGTKGTQLENRNTFDHDFIWRDIRFNVNLVQNLHLTEDYGQGYFENKTATIIDPGSLEGIVYKELKKDLWPQVPKYLFNYDWRLPNKVSGIRLNEFIDYIKEKSKTCSLER